MVRDAWAKEVAATLVEIIQEVLVDQHPVDQRLSAVGGVGAVGPAETGTQNIEVTQLSFFVTVIKVPQSRSNWARSPGFFHFTSDTVEITKEADGGAVGPGNIDDRVPKISPISRAVCAVDTSQNEVIMVVQ